MRNELRKDIMKYIRTKGYSLTELIVYMFIASMMLTVIVVIFIFMSRSYSHAEASYDVQREIQTGFETIRQDLSQTSLNSIVVYPSGTETNMSGVSMISAQQEVKLDGEPPRRFFKMSDYGTPEWGEHIFYTVLLRAPKKQEIGTPFQGKLGDLVRWNLAFDKTNNPLYPFPTDIKPSDFMTKRQPVKVILRNIPLANSPEIPGMEHFTSNLRDYGGFQVGFILQEKDKNGKIIKESLTNKNPVKETLRSKTNETSLLVQVNVTNVNISDRTGNLSARSFSFAVYPRN